MATVTEFPLQDDPVLFLRQIADAAERDRQEDGAPQPFGTIVAIHRNDHTWEIAYNNVNAFDRANAAAQIQLGAVDAMLRDNAKRYGLHTHD